MKLALWSASPQLGNVESNVATVSAAVRSGEADMVVFPELFLTGYNIGDDVQRLAFRDDDPRLDSLRAACREAGAHVVVGAPHAPREGVTFNAALCVDDKGEITWIHKRVLPTFTTFREGLFFAAGDRQPVWHTRHGNIGIHICYDLYFPEAQKRQVLEGADLLLNISASPTVSQRFFEALLPARAIENAVFSAYSNNVGSQDGIVFWGGAQAFGPRGDLLDRLEPFTEGRIVVELDWRDLEPAREFRPTIRDSRSEALEGLEA